MRIVASCLVCVVILGSEFVQGVEKTNSIKLYEGLPHPMFEPDALKLESARTDIFMVGDDSYYEAPIPLSAEEADQLKEIALSGDFGEWQGEAACGGFHGDFLIRWETEDGNWDMVLCFGCNEVKVFHDGLKVHADLGSTTNQFLKVLVDKRQNRPLTDWEPPYKRRELD